MPSVKALVRRNAYVDSITLLQVTAEVSALSGVQQAALVMATELNRQVLKESNLLVDEAAAAGANDLVIAIAAEDSSTAQAAAERAEALLANRRPTPDATTQVAPRSLRSAHRADPKAQLAVISVPGQFAAAEARLALADGLNVFLFSDNVAIEDEVDLKRRAQQQGLLVMGPDCGTTILTGVGFGFANVVRRGSVGLVGASGTGIQEVVCLIDRAGAGISHAIGTGSRDLSAAVGGITTFQGIDLLAQDAQTETIVLVSKPSDPKVATHVLDALAASGKRAVAYLQGASISTASGVEVAGNLEEAAHLATSTAVPGEVEDLPQASTGHIRGLFCGGTLCAEARATAGQSAADVFIDFGDDQYTRGRAHPMLDPTLRNQAIIEAGADPAVGVLLLDFVLGLGSHPDPAGAAIPAIAEAMRRARARGRQLAVMAHVVGTDRDPQNLRKQEATLHEAGVHLFPSNYRAAVAASRVVQGVAV